MVKTAYSIAALDFLKIWHGAYAQHLEFLIETGIKIPDSILGDVGNDRVCRVGIWLERQDAEVKALASYQIANQAHRAYHLAAHSTLALSQKEGKSGDPALLRQASSSMRTAIAQLSEDIKLADPSNNKHLDETFDHPLLDITAYPLTGNAWIDSEHNRLINLINQIIRNGSLPCQSDEGTEFLLDLIKLFTQEFSVEESLLNAGGNKQCCEAHHKDHSAILAYITELSVAVMNGSSLSLWDVGEYLRKWYEIHYRNFDRLLLNNEQ